MATRFRLARGLALVAALLAAPAAAQVTHWLPVQGRLTTPGGAPVTDPVSLTIRVHDALAAGNVDYVETDVVAPSSDGAFTTTLGDGGTLDPDLFLAPRWLSFEIDGGGELAPRTRVVPAPVALRAEATTNHRTRHVHAVEDGGIEDPDAAGSRLQATLAAITDAAAARPYVVTLGPGLFRLGAGFAFPSYVTLRGSGMGATTLEVTQATSIGVGPATRVEGLTVEFPDNGLEDRILVEAGDVAEFAGVRFRLDLASSWGTSEVFQVNDGALTLRGCHLAGTAGIDDGITLVRSQAGEVRLLDVDVDVTGTTDTFLYGVRDFGADVLVRGGRWSLGGAPNMWGLKTTGGALHVEGLELDLAADGSGTAVRGIRADGAEAVVLDCRLRVTGTGAGETNGIVALTATGASRISGNTVTLSLTAAGPNGIRASTAGTDVFLVGQNAVQIDTQSVLATRGIEVLAGRVAVTGNTVRVHRTVATPDVETAGIVLRGDSSAAGNRVEVSNSGDQSRGVRLAAGTDSYALSGNQLRVVGQDDAVAVQVASGARASLAGLDAEVTGDGPTVVGVLGDADVVMSGAHLVVSNVSTDVGHHAVGFDEGSTPSSPQRVRVAASRIEVSAAGGIAYLADITDNGSVSPDVSLGMSDVVADAPGADVSCTASTCPP